MIYSQKTNKWVKEYEQPMVEVMNLMVEEGFAATQEFPGGEAEPLSSDWTASSASYDDAW